MNHSLRLFFVFFVFCAHSSYAEEKASINEQVNAVKKVLREMPSWPKLSFVPDEETDTEARLDAKRIEESCRSLYQVDSKVIRKAIEELIQEKASPLRQIDTEQKIFLTLRGIFKIPRIINRDSPHFEALFSKWLSDAFENPNDYDGMSYPATWPWTEGNDGTMIFNLTRRRFTVTGGSDELLEVFDYLNGNFERRK